MPSPSIPLTEQQLKSGMDDNPFNAGLSGQPSQVFNQPPTAFAQGQAGVGASLIKIPVPTQPADPRSWIHDYTPMRILGSAVPGGKKWAILPDSGATTPTVASDFLKNVEHTLHNLDFCQVILTCAGQTQTQVYAKFNMFFEGWTSAGEPAGFVKVEIEALVLEGHLPSPLLLGNGWLKPHGCVIDYNNDTMTLRSLGDFVIPTLIGRNIGLDEWQEEPARESYLSAEERLIQALGEEEILLRQKNPGELTSQPTMPAPICPPNPGFLPPRTDSPPYPTPDYPPTGWIECADCGCFCKTHSSASCFQCRKHKLEGSINPEQLQSPPRGNSTMAKLDARGGEACLWCRLHPETPSTNTCFSCLVALYSPVTNCEKCGWEFECRWVDEKFLHDEEEICFHQCFQNT